jgi:ATP-binding cassette subfamily B protein
MATVSLKERFSALNNLPRFFKLVWQTSPRLMVLNAALRIIRSAIPVSILYVGKLIIDQVIFLSQNPDARKN